MKKQNINLKEVITLNQETSKELKFFVADNSRYIFDNKELDVKLEKTSDGFTFITVGKISYPIEIVSHKQNEYDILINGVEYIFSLETPFSLVRKKMLESQAGESSTILIKAPMPGKILEVAVKVGDAVKAGDTLLILEAMKMQNAILATSKAIVKRILVKTGDATSKSDLLIELVKE